jgi:hypothetical protein
VGAQSCCTTGTCTRGLVHCSWVAEKGRASIVRGHEGEEGGVSMFIGGNLGLRSYWGGRGEGAWGSSDD